MNLKQIEARLAEIKNLLTQDGADLEALNREADELLAKREELLTAERQERLANIANLQGNLTVDDIVAPIAPENREIGIDSVEYRNAWLNNLRDIPLTETEERAFSGIVSSNTEAVTPTSTANKIVDKVKLYAPLLEKTELVYVKGHVVIPIEGEINDAKDHTELANIDPDNDTVVSVELIPTEITKLVTISKTVQTMSIERFESWLTDKIAEALARKISAKIATAAITAAGAAVANTISAANVRALLAGLRGYAKNACFVCSSATLWNDISPLQDNSKNAFVTMNNGTFYIYGKEVVPDDSAAIGEGVLLAGDFKRIASDLAEDINITKQFVVRQNAFDFLGCAMFDTKVGIANAFKKIAPAAGSQ